MNILLVNDDGIESEGLRVLAEALAADGHDVYVCAPDGQRSCTGHGITILKPVIASAYDMPEARKAYRMSGMPADCVKMGLGLLEQQGIGIDIVYSGINNGSNVGTDTLYSGTVSAALEASVCGLPAVAVSVNSLTPEHYDVALELAVRASRLDYKAIDPRLVLNINTPNKPREEIRGVKVAELGLRGFYSWEIKSRDHEEGLSLAYGGEPLDKAEPYGGDSDIAASQQGYATVTPLHFNLTSRGLLEKVRASGIAD